MSRRGKQRREPAAARPLVATAADLISHGENLGAFLRETIAAGERRTGPPSCDRLISYDSLFWRCACGATGHVGRTPEGMPALGDTVRQHDQGAQLVELPPQWAGQYVFEDQKGI